MSATVHSRRVSAVHAIVLAYVLLFGTACSAALAEGSGSAWSRVVELAQRPGKFVQQHLTLHPGKYVFRVKNDGVGHAISFRLSIVEADGSVGGLLPQAALPRTLRDGEIGETGVVELRPGKYTYRCALNPTPHYFILVE